jgi:hypothetical protein
MATGLRRTFVIALVAASRHAGAPADRLDQDNRVRAPLPELSIQTRPDLKSRSIVPSRSIKCSGSSTFIVRTL